MNFSENLKGFRNDIGLTQKELGDRIGVTSVTIGNWERGVRQPSFELLARLADALGTSVDSLLGRRFLERLTAPDADAEELMKKYRKLDEHGKRLLRSVCDLELERVNLTHRSAGFADLRRERRTEGRKRYLPCYTSPSAAGIAAPLEGDDFEMLLADDLIPAEADYAVRISGDSMEPYIHDGDMVFVKECSELRVGEVGIFCVDGAMYCKQYYPDGDKLCLLSANPERVNANVYVANDGGSSVRCCGKVLLDRAIPLPGYLENL